MGGIFVSGIFVGEIFVGGIFVGEIFLEPEILVNLEIMYAFKMCTIP